MAIDGALIAIQEQANKLAEMIRNYSNEHDKQLDVDKVYYGCKELGWVCRIEVKP